MTSGRLNHRDLDGHQFAVINPLQLDKQEWVDLPTLALAPSALSSKAGALPRLLDLARIDGARKAQLLERADAWEKRDDAPFFAVLLKSPATAKHVAAHMARQLIVNAPDGNGVLLRWHDPRVLRHLRWLLTPRQMHFFSGPVSAWTWREATGRWTTHSLASTDRPLARVRLDARQWAVVSRMGVLNRAVGELCRAAPALPVDDHLYQRIDVCLQQAYDTHELTSEADVRLFVKQAILHPDIHVRPDMAQRLARARRGEISYVGACAGLDLESMSPSDRTLKHKDIVT